MEHLIDYIMKHSISGPCRCSDCNGPIATEPSLLPHSANLVFFDVALNRDDPPNAEVLRKLIQDNYYGINCDLDPLDGAFHDYFRVGAWIGDQGLALRLMGMGALLNLWTLMTPYTECEGIDDDAARILARNGLIVIAVPRPELIPQTDDPDREIAVL
jgi:hypothetical protein